MTKMNILCKERYSSCPYQRTKHKYCRMFYHYKIIYYVSYSLRPILIGYDGEVFIFSIKKSLTWYCPILTPII